MNSEDVEIWTEKYRPREFSDVVGQKLIVQRIESFVKNKNIPHMLFAGRPGCGKTTLALIIAKKLFGDRWKENFSELNASDERGIDVVREQIKNFARTKSLSEIPFKIIFLDEADNLTKDAQHALRRTMENYTRTARFILSANYSSRIIEPVQSRCAVFRFKSLDEKEIIDYLGVISKAEKIKISVPALKAISYLSDGDMRKAINLLQSTAAVSLSSGTIASHVSELSEDDVYHIASQAKPAEVKEMLELALKKKFLEARKKLRHMLIEQGLSGEDIIKEVHEQIYELKIPEKTKVFLLHKVGEYEYRIMQGGSDYIQLEAMLAQFLLA